MHSRQKSMQQNQKLRAKRANRRRPRISRQATMPVLLKIEETSLTCFELHFAYCDAMAVASMQDWSQRFKGHHY